MKRKPLVVGLVLVGITVAYLLVGRDRPPAVVDLAAAPAVEYRLAWAFDPPEPAGPPVELFGLSNQVVLTLHPPGRPPRAAVFDLDKQTGQPRWAFDAGGTLRPPVLGTGEGLATVIVGDAAGRLFSLDFKAAKPLWERAVGGPLGRPSVTLGREVFLPAGAAGLRKLQLLTGEPIWTADIGATAAGRLQYTGELVYVPGRDEPVVAAVHQETGAVVWRTPLPLPPAAGDFWPGGTGSGVVIVPLAADDGSAGGLTALDPATGDRRWHHALPGPTRMEPRLLKTSHPTTGERMTLHAATADGTVWAIEATTGRVYWSARVGSPLVGPPGFAWFYLFVVTADGRLVVLNQRTGEAAGVCDLAGLVGANPTVLAADPGPHTNLIVEADTPAGRRVRVVKVEYVRGLTP